VDPRVGNITCSNQLKRNETEGKKTKRVITHRNKAYHILEEKRGHGSQDEEKRQKTLTHAQRD